MLLRRYAHACFGVEDDLGRTWLFDPYRPDGLGGKFSLPKLTLHPHIILCTHNHEDHAWRARGWADIPVWEAHTSTDEATLETLAVPHDANDGTRMGFSRALRLTLRPPATNQIFTVVHAGDVGEGQGDRLVSFCKGADILLAPAGGNFTLGPSEAAELATKAGVPHAVLMHFREPGIDLDMFTPEEAFQSLDQNVTRIETGVFQLPVEAHPGNTELMWLAPTNWL